MKTDHFLYKYYKRGMNPFKSISVLSDDEIVIFMKQHFPKHSWFHANPKKRIAQRRKIDQWLYEGFVLSGGAPATKYPCYFTLGKSAFLRNFESFEGQSAEIEIPLSIFSCKNVSFTYPDSFFSEWLSRNRQHELYSKELSGKIFLLDEIIKLLQQDKIPMFAYMDTWNYKYEFYIEAQVWDYDVLDNYCKINDTSD